MALLTGTNSTYYQGADGTFNNGDENYGNYQFITLKDIVGNFLISYVGEGKIIPRVRRQDVLFHAQRAIQELSYDTFKSTKSQEVEVHPSLTLPLPHDYVNYVKVTHKDDAGLEHVIYPARKTSNPTALLQDSSFDYTFDGSGNLIAATDSETWGKYKASTASDSTEEKDSYPEEDQSYGRRFGIDPQFAHNNGSFFIDPIKSKFYFSSDLTNAVVTIKYISDSLATDAEMQVHKFAEEAMYKSIAYGILSTRANVPEYIIGRFKRERSAAIRQAKLRLSNLKLEEMNQIMKGKSKQIKH